MTANGTLMNHCGATLVTKGDLEIIPAPPPTETWFPVRHLDVLDRVEETLGSAAFEIRNYQLSDHRYMANCFRMFLHCLANNLLVSLRQKIADPPAEEGSGNCLEPDTIPVEAHTGRARGCEAATSHTAPGLLGRKMESDRISVSKQRRDSLRAVG